MLESKKYLAREELEARVSDVFVTIVGEVEAPQIFQETMKDSEVWWILMEKEFNMMKI